MFGIASLFRSNTILSPCLPLSSLTSLMPSITLSFTKSTAFTMICDGLTWNGTSVITICSLPVLVTSNSALPRITIRPRPVSKALLTPSVPYIIPPVGKSGAFTYSINPSISISLLSMYAMVPSMTSVRLCGAILVAIPTAIPEAPFTNKFGIRAGNTVGSLKLSSKFGL